MKQIPNRIYNFITFLIVSIYKSRINRKKGRNKQYRNIYIYINRMNKYVRKTVTLFSMAEGDC